MIYLEYKIQLKKKNNVIFQFFSKKIELSENNKSNGADGLKIETLTVFYLHQSLQPVLQR